MPENKHNFLELNNDYVLPELKNNLPELKNELQSDPVNISVSHIRYPSLQNQVLNKTICKFLVDVSSLGIRSIESFDQS